MHNMSASTMNCQSLTITIFQFILSFVSIDKGAKYFASPEGCYNTRGVYTLLPGHPVVSV